MLAALLPLLILMLLRLALLDARPIHHDESVNGWFVDGLLQRGYYIYDPRNYHGPWFFYWTALSEKLFGRNVNALRIPAVVFGSLLTLTPWLYRRWIGIPAAFLASCLLAVSPAMVFYSRYAIHESAFAFFEALFLALWLRIRTDGWTGKRAVGLGLVLGALAGLKENFVIFGAALLLSEAVLAVVSGKLTGALSARFWKFFALALATAFLLVILGFTGAFQDGGGVRKFLEAFYHWTRTGTQGNGHEKPAYYWLQLMARFEWPALLGLGLLVVFFKRVSEELRLIGLTGASLLLIYSSVKYKTPWCILSFYWAFTVFGSALLMQWLPGLHRSLPGVPPRILRGFWALLLAGGVSVSMLQTLDVAYLNPDQDGHPYVYGQTYAEMLPPVDRILERSREQPGGAPGLRVQVLSGSTWPLPFLLGELKRVGYYSESNVPPTLDADFVIMDESFLEVFSGRISGPYSKECVRARQWAPRMCFFTRQLPETPPQTPRK